VNLRLLIAHPTALAKAAQILVHEVQTLQAMRHPQIEPFDVVCGVPFGGLLVAEAFSLTAKVPLVYLHPRKDDLESDVEGIYHPSQTALIMDDLITGGGSINVTASRLRDEGLFVRDAIVLFDRQSGGRNSLTDNGIRVVSLLTFEVLLTYLHSTAKISDDWYRKSMAYFEENRAVDPGDRA
jgi:orotate phosphoribosyltransferase/uridine monophosphate synthetase